MNERKLLKRIAALEEELKELRSQLNMLAMRPPVIMGPAYPVFVPQPIYVPPVQPFYPIITCGSGQSIGNSITYSSNGSLNLQ